MTGISAVITAYNEESTIRRCLASLGWVDEIIVVDSSSTDATPKIAKEFTPHVYRQPNRPMLNTNKNYGFTKAKSEWILSLDADEEITPELAREIKRAIAAPTGAGYWISRKNILFGKWVRHGLWWPDRQLRLFRKERGKFPCKHVHEYLEVDGLTSDLTEPYIHYNYRTITQFIGKMDLLYTESEVASHLAAGYRLAWYDAIRFPVSDFVKIFFAQEGYKDGLHGLVLSLLQAFYSFIVFAKLWEREQFPEKEIAISSVSKELARAGGEVSYWDLTVRIKEAPHALTKIWLKLKRKYATV